MIPLILATTAAHAEPVPVLASPPPVTVARELAPGAHRVAVAGRITAISGVALTTGTLIPSAICALGGVGSTACDLSLLGTGVGVLGVGVGLTLEGAGSYTYLRKHRLDGGGPGVGVGVGLILGGVGSIVLGAAAPDALGVFTMLGAGSVVAGVVTMDVQHANLRGRSGVASWRPFVDPQRSVVGVSGRF